MEKLSKRGWSGLLWEEAWAALPGVLTSTVGASVEVGAAAATKTMPFIFECIAGVLSFRWLVFVWVLFWCGRFCCGAAPLRECSIQVG